MRWRCAHSRVARVTASTCFALAVRLRAAALAFALGVASFAWAMPPAAVAASDVVVPAAAFANGETRTITSAEFCISASETIPDAQSGCDWKPVRLAKVWAPPPPRSEISSAWMRLHVRFDEAPTQPVAMYLVAFNRAGRAFVNGRPLAEFGPLTLPLPLNWNRAQYAVIAPTLLHAGDNTIELHQIKYGWENGWVAPVCLGSEETLLPVYEMRRFWQNELVRILGATTAAIGIFMLAVWLGRRAHAMYFWFGCASLVWTAISFDYFAIHSPLPPLMWDDFMESVQVLRAVLMFIFIFRYCGRRMPVVETAIWLYWAVGTVVIVTHTAVNRYIDDWYLVVLLVSPYIFWIAVREGLRNSLMEGLMLGLAASVQIVLSAYDLWLFSMHSWTDRVYLAHFSAPLYLFVVGFILMRRFTESLNAYEKLAGVLEQRVAAKAAELERNYEQLLEARRNEALALERTRIMSEMHDGIGSQLTLALSLVRSVDPQRQDGPDGPGGRGGEDGRVATVLRESIEDLQLIIDSLEPVENDLLTVLGTLRYRVQDRLSKSGIELQWNVVDLPPLPMLTPQSVLQVLRILQEAFANCLKHSGATHIAVSTRLAGAPGAGETACISIVDDGRGIEGTRVGRGLENMRRRAEAIGGRLKITSRPGMTEVMLEVPTLREA